MNKRITDITVGVDQWGYVNAILRRKYSNRSGYYERHYGAYGNIEGIIDRAFRRLVRVQALQLALFKKNQEQQ